MNYSTNMNMNLPESADQYSVDHMNENTEKIDSKFGSVDKKISDLETSSGSANKKITTLENGKADTISYDDETGALEIKSGDTVLGSVTIKSGGGTAGIIVMMADELIGATFTLTHGSTVINKVSTSNTFTYDVPETGVWIVKMSQYNNYASQTIAVDVDSLAYYPICFSAIKLSKLTVTCTSSTFVGKIITVKSGSTSYSKYVDGTLVTEFYLEKGTWTISNDLTTNVNTVTIDSYDSSYTSTVSLAVIKVSCDDAEFVGKTITCTNGTNTYSAVVDSSLVVYFNVDLGTWTLHNPISGKDEDAISATSYGSYEFAMKKLVIVTWAGGTDAEILAMVEACDRGDIDLSDYWSVGDERTLTLSAMSATGVGESHASQSVTLVLMHKGLYDLNEATSGGKTKASFIVGLKNALVEKGYMNSSNTNSGSWNGSARRTWCNSIFYNAIPESIRSIFKQFKTITAQTYNGSTNQTSVDYFVLPAEKEIFGSVSYSNSTEAGALTQFDYYKTSANRIKKTGDSGSASYWWGRSPYASYSSAFCSVISDGSANYSSASVTYGLAPFGCI